MRLLGRGLILGGLLFAVAPAPASGTPLLAGTGGASCSEVLGRAYSDCGLFNITTLGDGQLDLSFGSDQDVFLFAFSVAADYTFSFQTLSSVAGLDSMLGLFDATGAISSYLDPAGDEFSAFGADIDPFGDIPNLNDRFAGLVLEDPLKDDLFYLAVLLNPSFDPSEDDPFSFVSNGFNGSVESPVGSLRASFGCEGVDLEGSPLCPGGGGSLSLQYSISPVGGGPAPVPEPGTLALLGTGALAALTRRRTRKRS